LASAFAEQDRADRELRRQRAEAIAEARTRRSTPVARDHLDVIASAAAAMDWADRPFGGV
jgi:hypothetical protein